LSAARTAELFRRYGTDAGALAAFIGQAADEPLPVAGYSVREMRYLIRTDAVEHLDDLLLRRTTLAVSGQLSLRMADAVLDVLAQEKQWPGQRKAAERNRFLTLLRERHHTGLNTLTDRNLQGV
jgi:glycerol-3-phosphate dehydrogenase